ncbi:MAG TPA: hypothetical protein PKN86_00640 [Candidatus Obscuribacter sp.]|nr:hypothetical protein [Candidatus Obscuribacter sp.]HMY53196.1 hypothetical protein [Candidatus Obscuribacter sp.]HNB14283.1 hypothetical protein [Candidatus Obscuribacter sp.]HND04600.1 hypothetical protein [Candidatus Obscuribacter sp.]HND65908.1 hypothetical protein [Candidatus Obscuribacter sp.]
MENENATAGKEPNESRSRASLWHRTRRYHIIIFWAMLALGVLYTPLQHSFTLGRYQHWGLSITCLGIGYLLQVIWSWRDYTKWARISYLSTACYFLFVGFTFYANPWLDARMSLQTEEQMGRRSLMLVAYFVMSLALSAVWMKWIRAEAKAQKNVAKRTAIQPAGALKGHDNNQSDEPREGGQ